MGPNENEDFLQDDAGQSEGNTAVATAEPTDAPVDAEATEALAAEQKAQAEADEKAAAKAAAEAADEEALAEFKRIADESARSSDIDVTTGTLPEKDRAPVLVALSNLSLAKNKRSAKDYLRDSMQNALQEGGDNPVMFTVARGYLDLFKQVEAVATKREPAPKVTVDPTDAHVERVVAMMLAANLCIVPDGVAEDWKEKANARVGQVLEAAGTYRDWLFENQGKDEADRTPEPEDMPAEILAAAKIAQGRAAGRRTQRAASAGTPTSAGTGGYTGERRSVSKHLAEAFANEPVGTILSIAQIAKFDSSEYGTDHPSSGAVTSALFKDNGKGDPKENVADGIQGVHADTHGTHAKGARKFA